MHLSFNKSYLYKQKTEFISTKFYHTYFVIASYLYFKMKNILKLAALFILAVHAFASNLISFDEFITKFDKPYKQGTEQYEKIKKIFEKNIEILKSKDCPVCGVTKFFDILPQQFEKQTLTLKISDDKTSDEFPDPAKNAGKVGAPNAIDWRSAGVVTSIKNQGDCGSCWAFVTAAVSESSLILKGLQSRSIDLSQQFLLECTPQSDCGGGFLENAIDTAIQKGLPKDSSFPYQPYKSNPGICYNFFNKKISTKRRRSFYDVSNEDIKDLLTMGPLAIALSSTNWEYYTAGVWKCRPSDPINHAVLLIGYKDNYWIIKNQWGSNWGEDGYIRVSMTPGENCKIGTAVHMLYERNSNILILFLMFSALILFY